MAKEKMTPEAGLSKTPEAKERRRLRSRSPVVAMVSHVSQETCKPILGIDDRRYLELLRRYGDELEITHVGKLRVVPLEDLRKLLSRLAVDDASTPVDAGDDDEDDEDDEADTEQPRTVDEELRRLGRKLTA